MFFDASGNMEEFNLIVFLMVTYSVAGALPLGIIITACILSTDATATATIVYAIAWKSVLQQPSPNSTNERRVILNAIDISQVRLFKIS